jgi:hypothetical protein
MASVDELPKIHCKSNSPENISPRPLENEHSGGIGRTINTSTHSTSRKLQILKSLANNPYFEEDLSTKGLKTGIEHSLTRISDKFLFEIKRGTRNLPKNSDMSQEVTHLDLTDPYIKSKRNSLLLKDLSFSSKLDSPLMNSLINPNFSATPEMVKHKISYFKNMPSEIREYYNSQKLKEKHMLRQIREKDKTNLMLLKKLKKDKQERLDRLKKHQEKVEQSKHLHQTQKIEKYEQEMNLRQQELDKKHQDIKQVRILVPI